MNAFSQFSNAQLIAEIESLRAQLQAHSDESVQSIFNALSDALFVLDQTYHIIHLNTGAETMFGADRRVLTGKDFFMLLADAYQNRVLKQAFNELEKDRPTSYFEVKMRRFDQSVFSGEININKIHYLGNDALIVSVRDLSTIIEKDEKHNDHELILDGLINTSGSIVFAKDLEGRYTSVNQNWVEMTQVAESYAIGKTDHMLFTPQLAQQFVAEDKQVLDTGETVQNQFSVREGYNERNFLSIKFPIKSSTGEITGLFGITTEIIRRKVSEERLTRLTQCMLGFGSDRDKNINSLVALAGEEFGAACALYNKLENGMLCSIGQWNTPQGYQAVDRPEGHICYDLIRADEDDVLVLNNLDSSSYQQSDPNVAAYNLKSYIGVPVKCDETVVGSLCIVYLYNFRPTQADKDFFRLIGLAISNEERQNEDELKLKESEATYRNIFQNAQVGLFRNAISDGSIVACNDQLARMCGFDDTTEFVRTYKTSENYVDAAERDRMIGLIRQQGEVNHFEAKFYRKDKSIFWVSFSARIFPEQGWIEGVAVDITAQKEAQLALSLQKAHFKAILENSLDSIWSINTHYEIDFINEEFANAFRQTFGIQLERGSNILQALPENIRAQWKQRYDRVFQNERFAFLDEIKLGDQTVFVEVSMQPIVLEGVVTGASFYGRNITHKMMAEHQLSYQAGLRKLLAELSTQFINLPNEQIDRGIDESLAKIGAFVGADRAYVFAYDFEKKLGHYQFEWCREGIQGFIEIYPTLAFDGFDDYILFHQKGENVQFSDVTSLPEGPLRALLEAQSIKSLLTVPLMNANKCIGFLGFDAVRQNKTFNEVEMDLLVAFAQMIVNVKERQQKENELLSATEKAIMADQLKTAFLQNMSHEIRTPLNGILGFVDLLKDNQHTEEERMHFLGIVEKSGKRLLHTINDILELSKIEAGQERIKPGTVQVNEMLRYFHDFFLPVCIEKNIQLVNSQQLDNEHAVVIADKLKLEAILSNLLNNAVKFTTEGQIDFGCTYHHDQLHFYVSDTGLGIPADRKSAIFDRFVQADLKITRPHEGSGLGLAIVKAYVDMMEGSIHVESDPGKGTRIEIHLPYHKATVEKPLPSQAAADEAQQMDIHILIAEDDDVSHMLAEKILHRAGITTSRAKDGPETLQLLRNNKLPDLILLDLKMPGMSGYEVATHIKQLHPTLPIIALTAYALAGDRKKAIMAGCNDYITKPVNKTTLLTAIRHCLHSKEG